MKFTIATVAAVLAAAPALAAPQPAGGPGSFLNFQGRTFLAVRKVTEKYPTAVLYECDGRPTKAGLIKNPETDFTQITCHFALRDGTQGSATVSSTGWGEFGDVVTDARPWLGDIVIDLPKEVTVSLGDAYKTAVAAGKLPNGTTVVTLRRPLYPGMNEPYYIFNDGTGAFHFVGATSGKIKESS